MKSKKPPTNAPVVLGGGSNRRFHDGQVLENPRTNARVIVLSTDAEGQKAMLFPLDEPERGPFEANAAWAVDWRNAFLPGPRLVELLRGSEKTPIWKEYVPSFSAAVALAQYFVSGAKFRLTIYPQNADEMDFLDHLQQTSYFKSPP